MSAAAEPRGSATVAVPRVLETAALPRRGSTGLAQATGVARAISAAAMILDSPA